MRVHTLITILFLGSSFGFGATLGVSSWWANGLCVLSVVVFTACVFGIIGIALEGDKKGMEDL